MSGVVHVVYFTDPIDPWSWAAEPALRRLEAEFADQVAITYVLGGLAREITDPVPLLLEALDAAAASAMPLDARGWGGRKGRAPRSTYPASLAVKAAAEQGADGAYLRAVREALWLRRATVDTLDALEAVARTVPALDDARFAIDLRSSAIAEAFGADLDRARGIALPTFEVAGERVAPADLRSAVARAGAPARPLPSVHEAVRRGGRLATAEVVAATDLPWARAAAELWRLTTELRLAAERVPGGETWTIA